MKADSARRQALLASLRGLAWLLGPSAGLGLAACQPPETAALRVLPPAQRTAPAPFSYTVLSGQQLNSQSLQGSVVLVNFWATTCGICVAEMPLLAATQQQFAPRGYRTLAVAMPYDPPALVADFASKRSLPFDVVIDPTGAVVRAFGTVQGTPSHFLLDRQGRVAARFEGAVSAPALHALVSGLLAET